MGNATRIVCFGNAGAYRWPTCYRAHRRRLAPPPARPVLDAGLDPRPGHPLQPLLAGPLHAAAGERQVVLHRTNAGNAARDFRCPRTGIDALHLTGQNHNTRVDLGIDLGVFQLRILLEALLDVLVDLLVIGLDGRAGARRYHLQLILDVLDAIDPLGHVRGGGLGLAGIDLPAKVDHSILGLHVDLAALDAVIREQGDLGLG